MFDLVSVPEDLRDRYNLAPKQPIPVIRRPHRIELLRWGLDMPDARMAGINARVESLSRPLYREKLRHTRCLVVVDGFYEWKSIAGKKFPYLISREDRAPMVFAGIYDSTDGCAILTAPSQGVVAALHDRMPVVLQADAFAAWIDPAVNDVSPIPRTRHGRRPGLLPGQPRRQRRPQRQGDPHRPGARARACRQDAQPVLMAGMADTMTLRLASAPRKL